MNTKQSDAPRPRLPLVATPANRDETTARDSRIVNAFVEHDTHGNWHVYKRPGVSVNSTPSGAAAGSGVYNWLGDIYSIFGTTLYKNTTSKGTVDGTGGVYTFSQALGATPKLFFQNGVKAYNYDDANGLVLVNAAAYPATAVQGNAYLDGTTYVMTPAAAIQGSGINDATSWQALNTLTAQIEPDKAVYLAKQLIYIIAIKQWSTEVFQDAANATGSPLSSVANAKMNQGCRAGGSVAELEGDFFWVSQQRGGSVGVQMLTNVMLQPVGTPPIERLLQQADFTTTWAFGIKLDGHKFYVLTLKVASLTLVYDVTEHLWYQWTSPSGSYWPFVSATFNSTQQVILQHETDGKLYLLENTNVVDSVAGVNTLIPVDIYTPLFDSGSQMRKTLVRMDFITDQLNGSMLKVRCSDNDYQTWTNYRTVDLSKLRPSLTNCGTFRKRAYHFHHACATAMRLQAVELDLLQGTV